MGINVVLFDLDDTLIVEYDSAQEAFLATCGDAKSKYGIEPEKLRDEVMRRARQLWHELPTYEYCLKIGISSWEGLWAKFLGDNENLKELQRLRIEYQVNSWHFALLNFNINNVLYAKELSNIFKNERMKRHIPFKCVIEILNLLSKEYRLGIITNGSPDLQREKIIGSNIGSYFEHILISGEENTGKPEKEIFESALNKFHINRDVAIMVGDSIRNDIAGANNAGIKSIWLNRLNKSHDAVITPTVIIKELNELPEVLKKLNH
jgi:putative hydrolase of the HAD superfamily